MIRILHYSVNDQERIFITEDLDANPKDFFTDLWTLVSDKKYDIEMPSSFPMDNEFIRN